MLTYGDPVYFDTIMILRRLAVAFALSVLLLADLVCTQTLAAPMRGPLVPMDEAAEPCTHPTTNLEGEVVLKTACLYEQNFTIKSSDTTLDCNGAQIIGGNGRVIHIQGQIENVTVKNCYLHHTRGIMVSPPNRLPDETDDQLRARSPKNVLITNVHTWDTMSTGMFFGPHVVGVTARDSIVERASSAGIYLEFGAQSCVIQNNLLRDNGLKLPQGLPTVGWLRREGVAVDAAAFNLIEGNDFEGNAFGGVFLYKNCWEFHSIHMDSPPRHQHAHSNIIRDNRFYDMPVGVWVAARQARDLGAWDCGDVSPYPNPISLAEAFPSDYPTFRSTFPAPYDYSVEYLYAMQQGVCPENDDCQLQRETVYIYEDFAEDNTIEGSRFENLSLVGVRVEDDRTIVKDNLFIGDFDYLYVGTPFRSRYLNRPVADTKIRGNSFYHPPAKSFAEMLALVPDEHVGTQLEDNHPACITPWQRVIAHGEQVTAYEADRVVQGQQCRQEVRLCQLGTLGGSFGFESCEVDPNLDASVVDDGGAENDGGTAGSGGSDSGCGCRVGGASGSIIPVAFLVLLLSGRWRRRRVH